MAAYRHDKAYDAIGAKGIIDAFFNPRTKCADQCLINECKAIAQNPNMNQTEKTRARMIAKFFSRVDFWFKTPRH